MTSMSVVELERPAVEILQCLAPFRLANDDPAAADRSEIEGVDGLGRGEEHVVRDVDDVVDRPEAHGFDPALQLVGRRADRDVPDDEAAITGAKAFVQDLDVGDLRRGLGQLVDRPALLVEGQAEHGPDLPGDAEVAERVRPVGVGLEIEDHVPVPFLDRVGDEADHGQLVEELPAGEVHRNELADPVQADLHFAPNCLRNLRSFS